MKHLHETYFSCIKLSWKPKLFLLQSIEKKTTCYGSREHNFFTKKLTTPFWTNTVVIEANKTGLKYCVKEKKLQCGILNRFLFLAMCEDAFCPTFVRWRSKKSIFDNSHVPFSKFPIFEFYDSKLYTPFKIGPNGNMKMY